MRSNRTAAVTAAAGVFLSATFALAAPSDAAAPATADHYRSARADWVRSSHVSAAEMDRYLTAAGKQLAYDGGRYRAERTQLRVLESIPLTDTTAHQRAVAQRVTRELNGFFATPGQFGVRGASHYALARADWVRSDRVAAAESHRYLAAASTQLSHYGARYHVARKELATLKSIPLTDTTAHQRAVAKRVGHALDRFFHTKTR